MAGLALFIFQFQTRKHADDMINSNFETNYIKLFGLRLPIMETVEKFIRKLPPEELESLKHSLVSELIKRKTIEKWKFNGRYIVAVDGTGLHSFNHEPFDGCPSKNSKTNKTTWTSYMLEAKLCCGNGLCISLASIWLDDNENLDDKHDCEQNAFTRLAIKLKKLYPRLPIIITADALYPNKTNFEICKDNNWNFIIVFKDGTLPSVAEEVNLLIPLHKENAQNRPVRKDKEGWLEEHSMFITEVKYDKYTLNWLEYTLQYAGKEPHQKFVHLTDMKVDKDNVWKMSKHGRMRWLIENQGFNTQKNCGYNLNHKFSRKYLWSMKNFYELLQIAHLINQLNLKLKTIAQMIEEADISVKAVFKKIVGFMTEKQITTNLIERSYEKVRQLRY